MDRYIRSNWARLSPRSQRCAKRPHAPGMRTIRKRGGSCVQLQDTHIGRDARVESHLSIQLYLRNPRTKQVMIFEKFFVVAE